MCGVFALTVEGLEPGWEAGGGGSLSSPVSGINRIYCVCAFGLYWVEYCTLGSERCQVSPPCREARNSKN